MYEKLTDAFKVLKVIFKGLFKLFEILGLETETAYDASKIIDDIADDVIDTGVPEKYID